MTVAPEPAVVRFRRPDGARIAYDVVGEGPAVLFVHGFDELPAALGSDRSADRKIGDPAGTPHWPARTDPPAANFHARAAYSQGHED
jgi:hypothetical protein